MESRVKKFLVTDKVTVKEAMRQMGKAGERVLFVVDAQYQLLGSLTDGDLRRWVLKNGSLASTIARVYNRHPTFVGERYNLEEVKKRMLKNKITWIPVVDKAGKVQNVLLWNSIFTDESRPVKGKINIPVVIMAGGKGTRLDPFTRILPKPLIPIGDKAIIEVIMDKFHCYGVEEFHVSINHKSKMIKAYFEEMKIPYKIHYIEEEKPLGTAGGIKFLQDKIKGSILVSNCDIIIEADYREMVDFHKKRDNDITIIGSFRHFTIPYGICTIENGGSLVKIDEKPEYDFLVNTGMYLLKQDVLELIPRNKYFDITDLIKAARHQMKKIGVFPIDEKSWIDVGQWEEYQRALRAIKAE